MEKIAQMLGPRWRMYLGPPPGGVWVVKRSALVEVRECERQPVPVVYLAVRAEDMWFVVGKARPESACMPVTFFTYLSTAKKAVEMLIEYGKKIFEFFPPQFDIDLIRAVDLCNRLDFVQLCEKRWKRAAARRGGRDAAGAHAAEHSRLEDGEVLPREDPADLHAASVSRRFALSAEGSASNTAFSVDLQIAVDCLFKVKRGGSAPSRVCGVVEVDFEVLRCLVSRWFSKEELEEWERCLWRGHVRRG